MPAQGQRAGRRTEPLSRERIVHAAIEILDAEGERALTFRALASRLATGSGAIYWHVSGKAELVGIATDGVVMGAVAAAETQANPVESIRAVSLRIFDAVRDHPWVGAQLSHAPWQPAVLRILESFGVQLQTMGVPERAQFDAASALVNYILGMAGQYAAGARELSPGIDRAAFLTAVTAEWADPRSAESHPFLHRIARQLREHDDRAQFLTGIDFILAGISTLPGGVLDSE